MDLAKLTFCPLLLLFFSFMYMLYICNSSCKYTGCFKKLILFAAIPLHNDIRVFDTSAYTRM